MSLHNYLKGDASTPKAPGSDKAWTGSNPGPYLGIVKGNQDPARMGRLQVFIPSLAKTSDPSKEQLITCEYLSPFYGTKGDRYANGAGVEYADSQHSYGFWAVPPDLETKVLVIFAEGKMDQAYWIGCVQDPFNNHMTPGIASSTNTNDALDGTFEGADAGFQDDKKSKYGSLNVPSGELNRNRQGALQNGNYESIPKPIHPLAEVLLQQGLSADDIRGNTSSSARRETPSQVFGISTPGRKDEKSTKVSVGTKDSNAKDFVTRKIGHTFVMDDGDRDGQNQLTRLRTASGHQLLMHDTEGVVYLANGSGKAFIEMDKDGTISVYSDGGINLRSGRDFNLHSDTNINFHAKGSLNFTAEANVNLNAGLNVNTMAKNSINNSSQGSLRSYAKTVLSSYSSGTQLHGASGNIDLAGAQVHFNSQPARQGWGPSWLVPEHDQVRIVVTDAKDIDIERPIKDGKPNTSETVKTTVTDFVTHEPYDRQSSTARIKKFINEAVQQIKDSSPDMSAEELKEIKTALLKEPTIKAVSNKLNRVVKLNDTIKLDTKKLTELTNKATEIQKLINLDPKEAVMNFVQGQVASAVSAVKSFFRF